MKNRRTVFLISIFSIFFIHINAQNLVPNYSFEIADTCPYSSAQIYYAQPWQSATAISSSDYFNSCNLAGSGVPTNFAGNQLAQNGNAYAGIVMYADPVGTCWREYIQAPLLNPLIASTCYKFICYISVSDNNKFSVSNLGAYFSSTAVSTCTQCLMPFSPQINYFDAAGIGNSSSWYKVESVFQASGGEQFITIGNFNADEFTTTFIVNTGPSVSDFAYYYIDSISLTQVVCPINIGINENENFHFDLYPNPVNEKLVIQIDNFESTTASIYNIIGELIFSQQIKNEKTEIDLTSISNGIYFVKVINEERSITKRIVKQ